MCGRSATVGNRTRSGQRSGLRLTRDEELVVRQPDVERPLAPRLELELGGGGASGDMALVDARERLIGYLHVELDARATVRILGKELWQGCAEQYPGPRKRNAGERVAAIGGRLELESPACRDEFLRSGVRIVGGQERGGRAMRVPMTLGS
jgi:hypothetical protein